MQKFRHIYIETYEVNVYFICCNGSYFERYARKVFGINNEFVDVRYCDGRAIRFIDGIEGTKYIIWIREKNWSVIAHECMHIVQWILDRTGMVLTDESVEAYCYLLGMLVRKIEGFLR